MKVAELQRFLGNFVPFAKAAGASQKVSAEFDRAISCFEPFKEKSLTEFNEFLGRADEALRTGKLTPPRKSSSRASTKAPTLSVEEAARVFRGLYARATDPALSYADIDSGLQPLEKLTMAQLKELAGVVDVSISGRTKRQLLDGLARWIRELKASHERTKFHFGQPA